MEPKHFHKNVQTAAFYRYSGTAKVTNLGEFFMFSGQGKFVFFEEARHALCENCREPNLLTTPYCFFRKNDDASKSDDVSNTENACIMRTVYPLMMYDPLF